MGNRSFSELKLRKLFFKFSITFSSRNLVLCMYVDFLIRLTFYWIFLSHFFLYLFVSLVTLYIIFSQVCSSIHLFRFFLSFFLNQWKSWRQIRCCTFSSTLNIGLQKTGIIPLNQSRLNMMGNTNQPFLGF